MDCINLWCRGGARRFKYHSRLREIVQGERPSFSNKYQLWWKKELYMGIHCCCCCCVTSVVSDSVRPHRWKPTRLCRPWASPGKNTGVGCHFLLQCMKMKSESEVTQLCLSPSDPMDCSPPGSSDHGIFQARVLEWGAIAFSKGMPTPLLVLIKTWA